MEYEITKTHTISLTEKDISKIILKHITDNYNFFGMKGEVTFNISDGMYCDPLSKLGGATCIFTDK